LASQAAGGGRLGTNLLDSNAVTEDQLTRALAEVHRMPGAGAEDLRGIPDEVIALLPAKLARRVQAIPFKAFGTQVHVALGNPDNLATQDEIVFAVGKRVVFYVAPEVRVAEALERYYGEPCSSRVASLVDRLNRTRFLWDRPEEDASLTPARGRKVDWDEPALSLFDEPPRLPVLRPPMPPPTEKLLPSGPAARVTASPRPPRPPVPKILELSEAERLALVSKEPPAEPEAPVETPPAIVVTTVPVDLPAPILTIEQAVDRLEHAADADAVGAILVEYLARQFDRVALFKAFRDRAVGWLGAGAELDTSALAAYEQSFGEASVFLNLRAGGGYLLGPLARMPAHRRFAALWGATGGGTWLFLPLRIHGRLVSVVALERNGETPRPSDVEQGLAVSTAAALAFERCILRRKKE
jgi:hypothetical protein